MKKCKRCLLTKNEDCFHKRKAGKDGLNAWCKSCVKIDNDSRKGKYINREKEYRKAYSSKPEVKERNRQRYIKDKDKIRDRTNEYYWSIQGQISRYLKSSRKRNLTWELNQSELETFYESICTYCGESYKGLGIDRVDNNIGYIISNCVPCCSTCNFMKRALSKNEFILKIQKIWENIEKWRGI